MGTTFPLKALLGEVNLLSDFAALGLVSVELLGPAEQSLNAAEGGLRWESVVRLQVLVSSPEQHNTRAHSVATRLAV